MPPLPPGWNLPPHSPIFFSSLDQWTQCSQAKESVDPTNMIHRLSKLNIGITEYNPTNGNHIIPKPSLLIVEYIHQNTDHRLPTPQIGILEDEHHNCRVYTLLYYCTLSLCRAWSIESSFIKKKLFCMLFQVMKIWGQQSLSLFNIIIHFWKYKV